MAIIVNLDVMMAKRKISSGELAEKIGITQANLSILKTGKAKAIRFSTLDSICRALDSLHWTLSVRRLTASREIYLNLTIQKTRCNLWKKILLIQTAI